MPTTPTPVAPLFNFSPQFKHAPSQPILPGGTTPIPPPVPTGGGGPTLTVQTCPTGYHWDQRLGACIANATVSGTFPVTLGTGSATTSTTTTFEAGTPTAIGGEGPITVNVANAVNVADQSAASAIQSVGSAVHDAIAAAVAVSSSTSSATATAIEQNLSGLTGTIANGIDNAFNGLSNVIGGIEQSIFDTLGGIGTTIAGSINSILGPMASVLEQIIRILTGQISGLSGQIATAIAKVIPVIIAAVVGAISPSQAVLIGIQGAIQQSTQSLILLGSDIAGGFGSLDSTLGRIFTDWESYNTAFVESQTGYPAEGSLHSDLSSVAKAVAGLLTTFIGSPNFKASDIIKTTCTGVDLQRLINAPYEFGDEQNSWWKDLKLSLWGVFINIIKVVPMAFKYWEELKYSINQDCPNERLSPNAIVEAVLRGFLTQEQGVAEASQGNLNRDRLKVLQDLAVHQMSPDNLVEALFRGLINESDYGFALQAQGWTPGQQSILRGIGFNLLTVTELWELVRRGTIDAATQDAALQTLHYDEPQRKAIQSLTFRPPNFQEALDGGVAAEALAGVGAFEAANPNGFPEYVSVAAQAEGLSVEATQQRWLRHWETGSIGLWVELLFRGLASPQQLQAVLDRNYIPRSLQGLILEGSRPLLQFRTIARMVFLKLITEDEGKRQLMRHGYSDMDADLLIQYARVSGRAPAAAHAQAARVASLGIGKEEYIDGSISAAQFYDILIAHQFTPEGANAEIAVIDAHQAMLQRKANAQLVVDEYGAGLINETVALAQLAAQGLTVSELARYAHKIRAFRTKNAKTPTEAELVKMLEAGIITEDDYINTLIGQGYSPKWSNAFLELSKVPKKPKGGAVAGVSTPPTA